MDSFVSGVHIHLLVNHAPIFGAVFALGLLIASYFTIGDQLRRVAFVVLVGTAITGAAANYSGEPAEDAIKGFPGVAREQVEEHEEMAETAFLSASVLGVLALGALLRWRRTAPPHGATAGILVGTALVAGMMAYTGLLGGRVRHSEVRPDAQQADAMKIEPPRAPVGPDREGEGRR